MSDQPAEATRQSGGGMRPLLAFAPLLIFVALAITFYVQLIDTTDRSTIPSALIGKQAPEFALPPLEGLLNNQQQVTELTSDALSGKVSIVNVWASWCVPCRQEHPFITELSKDERIQVVGINYKDAPGNAIRFLGQLGNPYALVGVDPKGKAAIDWGVYGIPETFVVGPDKKILYKHVGPIDQRILETVLKPEIEKALQ